MNLGWLKDLWNLWSNLYGSLAANGNKERNNREKEDLQQFASDKHLVFLFNKFPTTHYFLVALRYFNK